MPDAMDIVSSRLWELIIGALVLALVVFFVVKWRSAQQPPAPPGEAALRVAEAWISEVSARQADAAYARMSSDFRRRVPLDRFARTLELHPVFDGGRIAEVIAKPGTGHAADGPPTLVVAVESPGGGGSVAFAFASGEAEAIGSVVVGGALLFGEPGG